MFSVEVVVLCLEVESGCNWVGECECGEAMSEGVGIFLDAYKATEGVGSICTGHDGLDMPVLVVVEDGVHVVTCHDTAVALEAEHFVEVTYGELCRCRRVTRKCYHREWNPAPPCPESYAVTKYRA
jgi:hypothetical protein